MKCLIISIINSRFSFILPTDRMIIADHVIRENQMIKMIFLKVLNTSLSEKSCRLWNMIIVDLPVLWEQIRSFTKTKKNSSLCLYAYITKNMTKLSDNSTMFGKIVSLFDRNLFFKSIYFNLSNIFCQKRKCLFRFGKSSSSNLPHI